MSISGMGSGTPGMGIPPDGVGLASSTPISPDGQNTGVGLDDRSQQGTGTATGAKVMPDDMGQLMGLLMGVLGGTVSEADLKAFQTGEDTGFDSWSGMDSMVKAIDSLVLGGLQSLSAGEANSQLGGPGGKDLIRLLSNPKLAAADENQVNHNMNSSDVWKLIATVLSQLASIAQRDKVIESRVSEKAEEGKTQNRVIDQIQMVKMKAVKDAQIAKAAKLKKHGKVMKAFMIATSIVMAAVAILVIIVIAVVAIILAIPSGGTSMVVAIAIIIAGASIATAATAATCAASVTMTATGAMEKGGMVDRLIEALGLEANETTRMLANFFIQLVLGCINLVGSLVTLGMQACATLAMEGMKAALQVIIQGIMMLMMSLLATVLGAVVGSGMLDYMVREIGSAMGMDDEDLNRLSMLTAVAAMVFMIGVSIGMAVGGAKLSGSAGQKLGDKLADSQLGQMASRGGTRVKEWAAKPGPVTNLVKGFGSKIKEATASSRNTATGQKLKLDDENWSSNWSAGSQDMKAFARAMQSMSDNLELLEGFTNICNAIFDIVRGIMTMQMGKLQKEMGELEAQKAEIQYIMDLIEIMNTVLGHTIQFGLDLMEAVTEDQARTMELGNQIWNAVSRAGTAINEQTLA